jgi:hypothetical protein
VLVAVVLFPLVPWLMAGSLDERFSGKAALHSVAKSRGVLPDTVASGIAWHDDKVP